MKIIIDGKQYEAQAGETILQVARREGVKIPTLCHNDALPGLGTCRLCIVEVIQNNRAKVVTSCVYPITREIEVLTKSEKIIKMRKRIIKFLYDRTPRNEEINKLRIEYGIPNITINVDNPEQCILCGLCVRACEKLGTSAIATVNRGIDKKISTPYDEPSKVCIGCGSCAYVCPTNAIKIKEEAGVRTIWGKEFKMMKCSECGEFFATKEEYYYAENKLSEEKKSKDILCEKCRKKQNANKLKDIFENVEYQYLK
ncbi:2Fe-2S iron-sulfur cluster-binding protein [Clostridium sp. DL1XJH146]